MPNWQLSMGMSVTRIQFESFNALSSNFEIILLFWTTQVFEVILLFWPTQVFEVILLF